MSPMVHRVGNASDTDKYGSLLRFRVHTLCGLTLSPPRLLTDQARAVTCGRCQRGQRIWTKEYWQERDRLTRKKAQR